LMDGPVSAQALSPFSAQPNALSKAGWDTAADLI
jgi:hypothetical protein